MFLKRRPWVVREEVICAWTSLRYMVGVSLFITLELEAMQIDGKLRL